jgi:thioredoxin 1
MSNSSLYDTFFNNCLTNLVKHDIVINTTMADVTFTDQNFEHEAGHSQLPVLVDFWAEWCTPCKIVGPIVDELAKEYEGKLKVGKLDVDNNPQIASKFGVMSIPTIMVMKNGQPVKTMIGAQSKEALKRSIDEALAS